MRDGLPTGDLFNHRVLSRQPIAAIRWSPSVKERFGHMVSGYTRRCFFQRSVMGTPPKGRSTSETTGRSLIQARPPQLGHHNPGFGPLDGDLARRTTTRVGQDAHVFEADEMGDDLYRIDVRRGVKDLLFHTLRLKCLCAYAVDPR